MIDLIAMIFGLPRALVDRLVGILVPSCTGMLVPQKGLEPPTPSLRMTCSTN